MYARLFYLLKKVYYIGFHDILRIARLRIQETLFHKKWYTLAIKKQANHTFGNIAAKQYQQKSFDDFFEKLKNRCSVLPYNKLCIFFDDAFIIRKAQEAKNNIFDLLGSGPVQLKKLSWHNDFRLRATLSTLDCTLESDVYYKNINITLGREKELCKDIKVPWELSRFQNLIFLGRAYHLTSDETYAVTFTQYIMDWIDNNPFLLGVNWVCPMEVAIRSINWIWGFYFFKNSIVSSRVWQKFVCSLYDHFVYLENNWELSDGRTSNHYLSDLVGYLYLCCFFSIVPGMQEKIRWCSKQILKEMQKQVFQEGTSYEGSTQYHRLVTELFYHAYVIMQVQNFYIPDWYKDRLEKMYNFIDWCSPKDSVLVSIGDHDSGSVLYGGLSQNVIKKYKKVGKDIVKHYHEFGLSVIKTNDWHITLRHHAYTKRQPSGHFHNDAASITLAYKGMPILIDPGSYVYTASIYWRNYFRSAAVHNTFFIKDEEPVFLDDRLFVLDLPENKVKVVPNEDNILRTDHSLYKRFGLTAHRTVELDDASQIVQITDLWQKEKLTHENKVSVWNFTFAPGLDVRKEHNTWVVYNQEKFLVVITSNHLEFEVCQGWVSPSYGVKEQCAMLRASMVIKHGRKFIMCFTS